MKFNLFLLLFQLTISLQAQIKSISGTLVNQNDGPLSFINVLVYDVNNNYSGIGVISDENGVFIIKNIADGIYNIKFSALGFEEKTIPEVNISSNSQNYNLGKIILLESSYMLKSVDLIAEKAIMERKIDRSVLNVNSMISASGGTALDLLEQTPGIIVDRQSSSITMMGKGGVRIMVNEKMNYLPNDAVGDFLNGINADNIDSIELITTPPANFDADGNAGYINIVLKKKLDAGYNLNGNLSGGGGDDGRNSGNSGFNFNYVGERIRLNSNYAFTFKHFNVPVNVFRNFITDTFEEFNQLNILREHNRNVHNFLFAIETDLSEIFEIGMNLNFHKNYFWLNLNQDSFSNGDFQDFDKLNRTSSNLWQNYQITTYANFNFSKQFKIKFSLDYLDYVNRQPDINIIQFSSSKEKKVESLKKSPFSILYSNLDVINELDNGFKLSYGIKAISSSFKNDQQVKNNGITNMTFSAITILEESNFSGYLSADLSLNEKLTFKGGVRYEQIISKVTANGQIEIDRNYGNLFPSLFMGYNIDDDNKLNLSFTRRINRPSFKDMAPFFIYVDERTAWTGNPKLQPAFSYNFQIDYYFKAFFAQLNYSKTHDFIAQWQSTYDEDLDLHLNRPLNLDGREIINFQVSLPINLNSWWSLRPDMIYSNISVNDSRGEEEINMNRNTLGITLTQKININSTTVMEIFSNYNGKTINGNRLVYPRGSVNMAIRKKVSSALTVTLNAINIFDTQKNIWVTDSPNIYQKINFDFSDPMVSLSATFNLGKSNLKTIKVEKSDASSRF